MKKFAIVRWTTEPDQGKLSVVDVNDILGFTDEDATCLEDLLLSVETCKDVADIKTSMVYMVLWKTGRKGEDGWPKYEAELIYMSDSRVTLEKMIDSSILASESEGSLEKRISKKRRNFDSSDEESLKETGDQAPSAVTTKKKKNTEQEMRKKTFQKKMLEKYGVSDGINASQAVNTCQECPRLQKKIELLTQEVSFLKDKCIERFPRLMDKVQEILDLKTSHKETIVPLKPKPVLANKEDEQPLSILSPVVPSVPDTSIEIAPGTGISVNPAAWADIHNQTSAGAMISRLLMTLFPVEVLLQSSLKGGGENKLELDKSKILAMKYAVFKKFPEFPKGQFGMKVNSKLSFLRYSVKKSSS